MSAAGKSSERAAPSDFLAAFEGVAEAVESGAGLPAVARAASAALDSSVVVLDSASRVVAVACQSSEDERAVIAGEGSAEAAPLRVADERIGELRYRARGAPPASALLRMVATLIAHEVERARAPERASEAAAGDFLNDLFSRRITDRENIVARGAELGMDLSAGGAAVVARARPQHPEEGDWRARVLTVAERGARAIERTCLAAFIELGPPRPRPHGPAGEQRPARPDRELTILVPATADAGRVADAVLAELDLGLSGYLLVVALSRMATDPSDLHRAGAEALLAANVAEAGGMNRISFEETGAYRLLLLTMIEDPSELERFYEETVAPIVDYDGQYESNLVLTLDSFLEADGNVARTAEKLFTHRHTIRYRLGRVRELTNLDVDSTDGRDSLSLGLKAMRVLGIVPPGGPAHEAGAEAGRVPREEKDR